MGTGGPGKRASVRFGASGGRNGFRGRSVGTGRAWEGKVGRRNRVEEGGDGVQGKGRCIGEGNGGNARDLLP